MMCEFVNIHYLEGNKIQRKYRVLRFLFETEYAWFFRVQAIAEKIHGKIYDIPQPEKDMGFPKRKISNDGAIEELNPPPFYNKLRNQAILTGALFLQGDDSPPPDDKDLWM